MMNFNGIWLVDGEKHLQSWMIKTGIHKREGVPTYQYKKYEVALKWCKQFRHAVDVGAHVGQWSRVMAMDFDQVTAFEPVSKYRECWHKNLEGVDNIEIHGVALGHSSSTVTMINSTRHSFGDTRVAKLDEREGSEKIPMTTLDTFNLNDVDFLKIDTEGFELFILQGARETIERNKPCIIVEQKPGHGQTYSLDDTDAVAYLQFLGAKLRDVISGDYIMSWD